MNLSSASKSAAASNEEKMKSKKWIKTKIIVVRVDTAMYKMVKFLAKKNGGNVSAAITAAIVAAYENNGGMK